MRLDPFFCAAHVTPQGLVWELNVLDEYESQHEERLSTLMRIEAVAYTGGYKIISLLTGPGALPCTEENLEFLSHHYHMLVVMGAGHYPVPPPKLLEYFLKFEDECRVRLRLPLRPNNTAGAADKIIPFKRKAAGDGT